MANPENETPSVNLGNTQGSATSATAPAPARRGRPPGVKNGEGKTSKAKHKAAVKSVDLGNRQSRADSPSAENNSPEMAKFLGKGFVTLIELLEGIVHSRCAKAIEAKYPQKIEEFRAMAEELGLQPSDREMYETSISRIAMRHDWMTKYAPEIVLGVGLAQYSARQLALVRFVNSVTAQPVKTETTPVTIQHPESE